MSPFKSSKLSLTSLSSRYLLKRRSILGVAVTSTSNETWSSGVYSYIAFRSPGQFTVNRSGKFDVCVVGGGGGGGQGNSPPTSPTQYGGAGGGGAGGLLQQYNLTFGEGTYNVVIGGGGAGGTRPSAAGQGLNGSPSSIVGTGSVAGTALTAYGGGGGGGWAPGGGLGSNGATGGGGMTNLAGGIGNSTTASPGTSIPAPLQPQGYPGGVGVEPGGGGGGGGAAESGFSATPQYGGAGGAGVAIFGGDAGITTTYGTPAPPSYAPGRYVSGGGGGGYLFPAPIQPTNLGGVGGGGTGGYSGPPGNAFATNGTIYTGGGGGGGLRDQGALGPGAAGAPGVVIIRYRTALDD